MEERRQRVWGTRHGYGEPNEKWMEKEGIPVHQEMYGIADITELPRRPWARLGGSGCFIELEATKQGSKGLYVLEIPGGGAVEPEKHLYDELLYVLRGRGICEVWNEGQSKVSFEWGEGSLFAMPLNASHRLINGGPEPALVFGQTSAPLLINTIRDVEFVFNCPYNFTDRYGGEADYFVTKEKNPKEPRKSTLIGVDRTGWQTNFIPDVRTAHLDDAAKVEGGQLTPINMAGWTSAHSSGWPAGRYHKGHFHGPGAVLLGILGEGYVLLWNNRYGIHPFQDGHGDEVVKVDWKVNSIYAPQSGWFHQHFNTGTGEARHLATTGGGVTNALPSITGGLSAGSVREGGTLIEYEDEDPGIRRLFEDEIKKNGVESVMSPITYRTDPIKLAF